jgi:hypothetical protein
MMNQKPMMRPTRKENLRLNLGWHLKDYHGTVRFEGKEAAANYAAYILKRIEQLGGLMGRW